MAGDKRRIHASPFGPNTSQPANNASVSKGRGTRPSRMKKSLKSLVRQHAGSNFTAALAIQVLLPNPWLRR
jgi:hypothetical protein